MSATQSFRIINAGIALLLVGVLLSACASQESTVGRMFNLSTDFTLTVEADDTLNPSNRHDSAPVFLRLYELTAPDAFERAEFIDLYEREESVLGDSLVRRQQLPRIAPGEVREYELVLHGDTRYVGLLAEFHDYDNAEYQVVVPVTAKNVFRDRLRVRVSGNTLSVVR